MRHTLINFNMPNHLKNNLDMLVKFKRVSRTSILNKIIEEFCRTELKLIKEDRQINELISSYADNTSAPFVHNDEPINIPMINDYSHTVDDFLRL